MNVMVFYFAAIKDIIGIDSEAVELKESTDTDLWQSDILKIQELRSIMSIVKTRYLKMAMRLHLYFRLAEDRVI